MSRRQGTALALAMATGLVVGGCSRQAASHEPVPSTGTPAPAATIPQAPESSQMAAEPQEREAAKAIDRDGAGRPGAEGRGEHDRDHQSGAGEETGTELALNERYDRVRNGVRLTLAYDSQGNVFRGEIENTTGKPIEEVRVEVHLGNGVELGPTARTTLAPGEKRSFTLTPTSTNFTRWTTHAEVGRNGG